MVVNKLSTGGLYNAPAVRGGVVGLSFAESDALGHCGSWKTIVVSTEITSKQQPEKISSFPGSTTKWLQLTLTGLYL